MKYFITVLFLGLLGCSSNEDLPLSSEETSLYFPPITGPTWETTTPQALNWNTTRLEELKTFLQTNETRGFIILKDGKIVMENYWNQDLTGNNAFTANSLWQWNSAGKSLTSTLVGLAQQDRLLQINDKTSDYLGANWTSAPANKQALITIKNQLSMTTGLDFNVPELNCTTPNCLLYKKDAGTQWYYHNAPYTLLEKVIAQASGMPFDEYSNLALENKIGMNGRWINVVSSNTVVHFSTTRDAARFGLFSLAKGRWGNNQILTDVNYFQAMTSTSQTLNPSYGYLWWLNGKNSVLFPGFETPIASAVSPNAPGDLVMALGKDGQFIEFSPSRNLVLIRFGKTAQQNEVPIIMHDQMWEILSDIVN